MSKYEEYFIDVSRFNKIDIYRYLELLPGHRGHAIEHAIKKLVLCGVRTGGKPLKKDIIEARDTLSRKIQMWEEDEEYERSQNLAAPHDAVPLWTEEHEENMDLLLLSRAETRL